MLRRRARRKRQNGGTTTKRSRSTRRSVERKTTRSARKPRSDATPKMQFQPNWWFRVELELDERGDAPADPASEVTIRQRIETLCGSPPER
jgi:hypothetical protein